MDTGSVAREVKLTLPGSIRSKKNSKRLVQVGGKRAPKRWVILPSKTYQQWEKQARWAARAQYKLPPMEHDVHVEIHVFYKGPMPDLSGCLESCGDCLEGIVWLNDKQIKSWDGSRLCHDIRNPRTEVIVRRFGEPEKEIHQARLF